jgi:hypothetical protein
MFLQNFGNCSQVLGDLNFHVDHIIVQQRNFLHISLK